MSRKKYDFTFEKILELADKYHLEYEKNDEEFRNGKNYSGYIFYLPTGYVNDMEEGEREDLFCYYGINEKIGICNTLNVIVSPRNFKIVYDGFTNVENMFELEQIVSFMVNQSVKFNNFKKEYEQEKQLMATQKDFQ